jgi:methionyl-tRNA formyltransferase
VRIAVIGRTQVLYDTALALRAQGHQIGCVITAPAAPEYTRTEEDFRQLAVMCGAPYFCATRGSRPDFETLCRGLDIGVSVNWVSLVSARQLALFRIGMLNAHHGDLPAYRGNACSNWAILQGESSITATIHLMEGAALDCGRIVCQERYALTDRSTIGDVYTWSERSTPALFARAIELLDRDPAYTLKIARPDSPDSFRCYPRMPEDNFIDWTRPARDIDALVRASSHPFPGAYTFHWDGSSVRKLRVLSSRVVADETNDLAAPGQVMENNRETGESLVRCGAAVLALETCRYDDESEAFAPGRRWTSIRMRLGVRAEDWLWELSRNKT